MSTIKFNPKGIYEISEKLKKKTKDENGLYTYEKKDAKGYVTSSFKYKEAEPKNASAGILPKTAPTSIGNAGDTAITIDANNPLGTKSDTSKTPYNITPQLTQQKPIDTPKTVVDSPKTENNITYTEENTVKEKTPHQQANEIRENVRNAVNANPTGLVNTELFDDIDDDTILNNRALAEETIHKNVAKGFLKMEDLRALPYLKDGLTLYYAGAEKNKFSEANKARNAAYKNVYAEDSKTGTDKQIAERKTDDWGGFEPPKNRWSEMKPSSLIKRSLLGEEKKEEPQPVKQIDDQYITPHENAPKNLLVEGQSQDTEARAKALHDNTVEWIMDGINEEAMKAITNPQALEQNEYKKYLKYLDSVAVRQWFKENVTPKVRYTGAYCLPVEPTRINQGFYGTTSHAGTKNGYKNNGKLGAIDFRANKGQAVYSVLGGEVVYVPPNGGDYHRVTVETFINGEPYYLEYLHMNSYTVSVGDKLKMGQQIGGAGGWGRKVDSAQAFPDHLDFRVYQFKDPNNKQYNFEDSKIFIDPFELFDFDVQFKYDTTKHDYN